MPETFAPTLAAAQARVVAHHPLDMQHKFVYELGWRAYFRHVWLHRSEGILRSLHEGPLPDDAYAGELPPDIRLGCTGVPVVDEAVRTLYTTGLLHNHARMWLASYVVHMRKVHWRTGADWLYGHLLDGDLASNHLSWQWVAGTGSSKPYLFNADSVARYAPASWHSPGSVIDTSYEALDRMARQPRREFDAPPCSPSLLEPTLGAEPPVEPGLTAPDAGPHARPRRRCFRWLIDAATLSRNGGPVPRVACIRPRTCWPSTRCLHRDRPRPYEVHGNVPWILVFPGHPAARAATA